MKAPEGTSEKVATKPNAFGKRFVTFKESVMATPNRAAELKMQHKVLKTPQMLQ